MGTGFGHIYLPFSNLQFLGGLEDAELKSGNFQSLTRKLSYSSFFSVLCPDLKNVFFGKIHWAPSKVLEVKRPFSRSRRPNFGFHLFLVSFGLEISSFWVSRLFVLGDIGDIGDLKKSPVNVFKNYIFEISVIYWSKCTVECAIRLILISKYAQARCDFSGSQGSYWK